jgi:hypothetical protein
MVLDSNDYGVSWCHNVIEHTRSEAAKVCCEIVTRCERVTVMGKESSGYG